MLKFKSTDVHDATSPRLTYAWYVVGVLFVAYVFSFVDRYILSLLIEPIKQDLALNDTSVSLLHGLAFSFFYATMGIPIGRLVDRHSRRTIAAVGIATWSLMTALCGVTKSFSGLFLARMGVGVGEAALSPAAYSMIADLFPPAKLGKALAVYSSGAIIGGGLAFIVGGVLIQILLQTPDVTLPLLGTIRSWKVVFFVVGLPGLLVAAVMYTMREPVRRIETGRGTDEAPSLKEVLGYLSKYQRVYYPVFGGFLLLALLFNVFIVWSPTMFLRSHGMQVGQSGPIIGTLILTFGAGGMIAGGWLVDRLFARGFKNAGPLTGIIAAGCALPFGIAMPLVQTSQAAVILSAPLWFFATSGFGAGVAAIQFITPNRMRGVVSAFYLLGGGIIAVGLGPTMVAMVTDYAFGYEAALRYSMSIIAGGAAVLAIAVLALGLQPFNDLVKERDL